MEITIRAPFFLLLLIQFFFQSQFAVAQTKRIEILSADALTLDSVHNEQVRKLAGNVKMKQENVTLACDSAYFYTFYNRVDAYGNVHIFDEEVEAFGDSLFYDGDSNLARIYGDVKIIQEGMELTTTVLHYNTKKKSAVFFNGGKLIDKDLTLTSRTGSYFTETKRAFFRDSVRVTSEKYDLETDTLNYDTQNEITYFYGPSVITTETDEIECIQGSYNEKTDVAKFGKQTLMKSETQILYADSLIYNNVSGEGQTYKYFRWTDTTMGVILSGKWGKYLRDQSNITATDSALMIYMIDGDSLFLTADTLKSYEDTTADITEFYAYHDVKIFKHDLQGLCDSLSFSYRDSVIRMYHDPVLWNEQNQLTGDTITIQIRDKKIKTVELFPNGFIIGYSGSGLYDQIKGKHITGYFKDSRLNKMLVQGNGESIYYGKDDDDAFVGVNKAICSNMWIYMAEKTVHHITFLTKPDASFNPIQKINPKEYIFPGFLWREAERPQSILDLFD